MDAHRLKIMIVGLGWLGWPLALALRQRGYLVSGTTRSKAKQEEMMNQIKDVAIWTFDPETPTAPAGIAEADVLIITMPPGGQHSSWHQAIEYLCGSTRPDALILYTSTTGVYRLGMKKISSIAKEDEPLEDSALLTAEKLVRDSGRPFVVLRLAGLVGGERKASRFLAGKTGLKDASAPVNLVHRIDVIKVVIACIEKKVCCEVINVCSDSHPPKKEYYTRMAQKAGLEPPQFSNPDAGGYVVDNTKMKELLGVELEYPDPYLFE